MSAEIETVAHRRVLMDNSIPSTQFLSPGITYDSYDANLSASLHWAASFNDTLISPIASSIQLVPHKDDA